MRLSLLAFLLLPALLYAQKNKKVHYIITTQNESVSGKEITTTSVLLKKLKADKNALLFELNIDGIRHENSAYNGYFSSFAPDSNFNFTRSTIMVSHFLMLNKPLQFEVRNGRIQLQDTATLTRTLKEQLLGWKIKKNLEDQIVQTTFTKINTTAQQLFFPIAETAHTQSLDAWLQSDASKMYKRVSRNKKWITLSLDSANTNNITQLHRHTLQILNATNNHTLKLVTENAEKETSAKSMVLAGTANPVLALDSAYTNMIVKGSYWSDALNDKSTTDSIKVLNYIDWYAAKFPNDKNFIISKLGALQQINDYERYQQELRKTPSSAIEGTHHVSNKINDDAITDKDFNELVPMLDKNRLHSWLQHSHSQVALRDVPKAYQTTEKLVSNFSKKEREAALPLHLWVKALACKNADSTQAFSNQLIDLDNQYWKEGNAARYALLFYKILVHQKSSGTSDYLKRIVDRLTPLYEDSLNDKRYLQKALLATAYYFGYKQLASSDSINSIKMLRQAAFYSPQNAKEKAHGSFYDRVFLESEESYNDEYLNKLTAAGRKDIALQEYIKEFLGNQGTSFKGLKSFYDKNYDAATFASFFKRDIIPQLQNAPEFKLLTLNDEAFSLEKFKGMWTVLDFWGTWCGPCVAEMPKLNKYHEQLKTSQARKIRFMTIACYDTKDKVAQFLADNKYGIPVLMSDGKVEKDYKVPGYPSKYIITPEGKIITTEFGFDWESLVSELSQL